MSALIPPADSSAAAGETSAPAGELVISPHPEVREWGTFFLCTWPPKAEVLAWAAGHTRGCEGGGYWSSRPFTENLVRPNPASQGSGGAKQQLRGNIEPDLLTQLPAAAGAQPHSRFPRLFQEEGLGVTQNPHA